MIVGEDLILCRHLVLWLSGFRLKGYTDSELPKLNACILCISSFADASILTVSSEKRSRKCSFLLLFVRVLYQQLSHRSRTFCKVEEEVSSHNAL